MRACLSACLFFTILTVSTAVSASAEPKLSISNPVFKFGEVVQGTIVEKRFEVRNSGDAPLIIQRIQPSCGCTVVQPGDTKIAPGNSTLINASFNTQGFQGYKMKTIRVYTNDPKQDSIVLTFQGTITTEVKVDPPRVYLGSVRKGEKVTKKVTLTVDGSSPTTILSAVSRSEFLSIEPSGGAKKKTLSVTLNDNVDVGVFRSRVVVKTDSKQSPVINIPVFARVEGDIQVFPSDVSFGLIEGPLEEAKKQPVQLVNRGEGEISLLSVKSSNPSILASVESSEKGKKYQLSVSVLPGTSGPFRGEVTIVTDHPDKSQSEIKLPVYGIVSKKGA